MAESLTKSDIALTAVFAGAVAGFVTGLPMDFISEMFTFPWAHETAFGAKAMEFSSSILVPFYDAVGQLFGIDPVGQMVANVPVVDL